MTNQNHTNNFPNWAEPHDDAKPICISSHPDDDNIISISNCFNVALANTVHLEDMLDNNIDCPFLDESHKLNTTALDCCDSFGADCCNSFGSIQEVVQDIRIVP